MPEHAVVVNRILRVRVDLKKSQDKKGTSRLSDLQKVEEGGFSFRQKSVIPGSIEAEGL